MLQKFKIKHGWKSGNKEQWNIALERYGVLYTNDENNYKQTIKDGYLEIEIEEYSKDTVL